MPNPFEKPKLKIDPYSYPWRRYEVPLGKTTAAVKPKRLTEKEEMMSRTIADVLAVFVSDQPTPKMKDPAHAWGALQMKVRDEQAPPRKLLYSYGTLCAIRFVGDKRVFINFSYLDYSHALRLDKFVSLDDRSSTRLILTPLITYSELLVGVTLAQATERTSAADLGL